MCQELMTHPVDVHSGTENMLKLTNVVCRISDWPF